MDSRALISAIQEFDKQWPECLVIKANIDLDEFCIKTSCSDCALGVAYRTTNQRKALVYFLEELNG